MVARAPARPLDEGIVTDGGESGSLAALAPGRVATVTSVSLESDLARWLAAIGIGPEDRVTVLRRAPFGGPIHLRTHTGGEFAIDRALARAIAVAPLRGGEPEGAT